MSKELQLSSINFFICSTYVDLKAYREAVIERIKSKSGVINAQEFFGARSQQAIETCLEEVEKSNVFVMFLGYRYGSIEPGSGKSYAQLEYEKAKEIGLPRLAYFLDESHPFPPKHVSTGDDARKLREFKKQVQKELTIDKFTTPDDLAEKVIRDLIQELPRHDFKIGTETQAAANKEVKTLIRQFFLLPKIYYAQQFSLSIELGDDIRRAPQKECEAFSMRYGATVRREFKPTDKGILEEIDDQHRCLYAADDNAVELIKVPSGTKLDATLKTIQGDEKYETPVYGYEPTPQQDYLSAWVQPVVQPAVQFWPQPQRKVIVDYKVSFKLICGFEFMGGAD